MLIAEDDALISNDLSSLLRSKGFDVVGIAHTSEACIHLLKYNEVDLAILDIHMNTATSGVDIAKHINANNRIPFIFLTSYSDDLTQQSAQAESPFGYLVKPYQEATLLATINLALRNYENRKKKISLDKVSGILTYSELRLCEKLCTSLTYAEIAESMFVSIHTVRFHVKNIYFKLDLKSRSELLIYLQDRDESI